MEQNELLPLSDYRQAIHNLILRMHITGLSPPEQCILEQLEAQENRGFDTRANA